jgi:acyl carrier protein
MKANEIEASVLKIVGIRAGLKRKAVKSDRFGNKGIFLGKKGELGDDLDKTEILMAVEEEFNVEFSDSEDKKIATAGDLIDIVKEKLKK